MLETHYKVLHITGTMNMGGAEVMLMDIYRNIPLGAHHFRHFTIEILTNELEKYFEIVEIIPFEKLSYKKKWIMRLLANRFFIINHKKTKNKIYKYYKKNLFLLMTNRNAKEYTLNVEKKS